jgi:signal transduction histidine kinase
MITADAEVGAAQLQAVHRQVPAAVAVSVVNAALLVLVLGGGRPGSGLLAWLAAVVLLGLLRLLGWRVWRRDAEAAAHHRRWALVAGLGAGLAGLSWGGGAALLWPASETAQLFWVFVVGGMCTGAAALHYPYLPAVLAYILPAGLPIAARLASEGAQGGLAAGAMVLVFLAALIMVARHANAQFRAYALLRRDLRVQAQELDAARVRLHQEVEDHRATTATLQQAQKMEALGQLTGGIAHDFNNLLMVVLGSLALLRKRLPEDDARALRLLDNAVAGANRGAMLTQRLLAFGRRQTLRPEAVALHALLDGAAELLRRSLGPAHALRVEVPATLPAVAVDPNQLELALLNLVLNARDALPPHGEIAITARLAQVEAAVEGGLPPGAYVVLAVSDRGAGMDAATLARATEPFFTTKGVGKGTGLGLSMVYGLAEQSGGRLVLHSHKGEGTVAELWLRPATAGAPAQPPLPAPAATPAARRLSVLLVDDDPMVLASTADMLQELGHGVLEADGAVRALERVQQGAAVDLVVTDYGMPGMSGTELTAALRRLRPRLPVILATGYGEVPEAPPRDVTSLRKPFAQEVLGAAIAETMARAE